MIQIQRLILDGDGYQELYTRGGTASGGRIRLRKGERLSFDTYFGCLDCEKYLKYTDIKNVTVSVFATGDIKLSMYAYDGNEEVLLSEDFEEGAFSTYKISIDLTDVKSNSIIYPVVEALEDGCTVINGGYYTPVLKYAEDISIAMVICTYKREKNLKSNLEILKDSKTIFSVNEVLVVDNGNTLTEEDALSERIRIIPNKNCGGSAGFTRGIMEAYERGHSHVILMDDDIEIYPETIKRMTAIVSFLKEEYKDAHLSAAMLPRSKKNVQFEMGARWSHSRIESLNTGIDLYDRNNLIQNLADGNAEYGAWWCFCMPTSDVKNYGLPLPIFIKFDDVEYGRRTCGSFKTPIITMNGMAVSHEDFDFKYSMHLEYYTVRNQLIMLACRNEQSAFGATMRLIKVCAKHLFLYRYCAMPIVLRAFNDFLQGADFLLNTDAEKLNREIMDMAEKPVPLKDVPEWDPSVRERYTQKRKSAVRMMLAILTLGGHLIPGIFMKRKPAFAPLPSSKPTDCFMHRTSVQYQVGSENGYVFKKSSPKFFKYFFKCIALFFRILFQYKKAKKSFINEFSVLTDKSFWEKYLELDNAPPPIQVKKPPERKAFEFDF